MFLVENQLNAREGVKKAASYSPTGGTMPVEANGQAGGYNPGFLHYMLGLCGTCLPSVMSAVKKKASGKADKSGPKRIRRETWPAVTVQAIELTPQPVSQNSVRPRTRSSADYVQSQMPQSQSLSAMKVCSEDEEEVLKDIFPFNDLPQECQLKIFSFLSLMERGNAAKVCIAWHELVQVPSLWSMVDLTALPLCTKLKISHKCGPKCYDIYKKRLKSFIHFLEGVPPALRCFRFSLDIGDPKDKWLPCVEGLLKSSYCKDLEVAQLDWKETPVKPFFMDDHSHLEPQDRSYAHRRRQRFFISFFDSFTKRAPNIRKLIVPFDWSKSSMDLIARLGHSLNTLVIEKYFVFRQLPQESLSKLIASLPHLNRLILEVWTPSVQYFIVSTALQYLDISQSRGFYLKSLDTPELKVFKVARHPWNGPLTRVDDIKIPCIFQVLVDGAPNLQQLNEHTLHPDWKEGPYPELETVLRAVCSCRTHKSGWADKSGWSDGS